MFYEGRKLPHGYTYRFRATSKAEALRVLNLATDPEEPAWRHAGSSVVHSADCDCEMRPHLVDTFTADMVGLVSRRQVAMHRCASSKRNSK